MIEQQTLFQIPKPTPRLVYNGLPPRRPTETSRAAAMRMRTRAPSLRMKILAEIRTRGDAGMTAEESGEFVAEDKGQPPDTTACRLSAAARITELKLAGFVADSGRPRLTRAGCSSIVWVPTAKYGDGTICEKSE